MKKLHVFLTLIVVLIGNTVIFGSEPPLTLTGKIVSGAETVPFATINIKGTTIGTVSDANGSFALKQVPAGNHTLRVQSVGFKPVEIIISEKEILQNIVIRLETDQIGLNEVVVSANRYETNRQEAPVIVNVLNAKLLQSGNAVCLSDGLSLSPGLRVENNCQNCGFQQVRINGLEGPYSQILIDSRPLFSALSGVYGIEQIPLAMIEKVEVVRGGGSALYGSNAIAGTINIITREPVRNTIEAGIHYTSIAAEATDRSVSLNGSLVSNNRKVGAHLFATKRNRDQYDANGDGFSELGLINSSSLGMRSFYKTSNQSKITATYHYINEFRRGGNKFDLLPHETDITEQTDHRIHGGELVYDLFSKNLKTKWSVYTSAQYINRDSYYGAQQDPNAYGNTTDITFVGGTQLTHKTDKLIFASANLVGGAEFQLNNMHDVMPGYDRDLKQDIVIAGLYGQSEWKLKNSSLLLGLRADKHNLIDKPILSPRATFLYNLTPAMQWRSSFSTGFRAPQAFDEDLHIIAVNGGVMLIQLDPDLRPEYSKSISSSLDNYFEIAGKPSNFMVEGFYTRLDDVFVLETLETDAQGNLIVERRNGSGAKVFGLHLENRTAISNNIQLQAGITLQQSRYLEPEAWSENETVEPLKVLPKSPNVYGYAHLSTRFTSKLSAVFGGTLTGPMKVTHYEGFAEMDEIKTTPAFVDVNAKISYQFKLAKGIVARAEAGVQNIFNSYQRDFDEGIFRDAGYMYGPMKPRSFFVSLKTGNLL